MWVKALPTKVPTYMQMYLFSTELLIELTSYLLEMKREGP